MSLSLVRPGWPAPSNIIAFSSTRLGGVSKAPYDSLNLALHVGDSTRDVMDNRKTLIDSEQIPYPQWLNQTHSTNVVQHGVEAEEADGCYTSDKEKACLVMTADCLPVLLCDESGSWVAAVHAGWRGLSQGVLQQAVKKYRGSSRLMAWIGPAISQQRFEVGSDVRESFLRNSPAYKTFFEERGNKWLCDLPNIAEYILKAQSVDVYQCGLCTYDLKERFYSHRRETHNNNSLHGAQTGRMVTAIWINNNKE
ncbi:peptidoglycan editing factor PgeF [Kangiella sediminilitoris]|uniref:Purine nucleoside phosphorylase n=1 Tax=Kangiella sediminilitoris TaxID=1144748 RepID=A0A1B3BB34_9GAMM|nr:peptidoglycan editing factor PgeF [Kangiella sediminilitoris]AOE49987.1 polyphenol oxidase [Kangiella sediminilitoris]